MITEDNRWEQRFNNYKKALQNLSEAVELSTQKEFSKLEKQGVIQAFAMLYEICWNTIRDFYQAQGETNIQGSRDAFKMAFNRGLITDGEVFMKTIKSRQLTSHTYNEETAEEIYFDIIDKYYDAFKELGNRLEQEKKKQK
ncbi:MAG: nucleotidyltransferase substrate binding protein [Candidatus Marinimicrobia bacterium]|nr:nucleotidyltransferase substrate binding protein [Candidatus Neomarinimicrobiota bacterium]